MINQITFMRGRVSDLPLPSIINKIVRASFFPKSHNNDEIRGHAWNVIKHTLEGTSFDVMDLIMKEFAT